MPANRPAIVCAIVVVSVLCSTAKADFIAVNFGADQGSMLATDTAGVVPQQSWSNASGANGALVNLNDDTPGATTADVAWSGYLGTFQFFAPNPATDGNEKMMSASLYDRDSPAENPANITFSQIPYPAYDVIVYSHQGEGTNRVSEIRLTPSVANVPGVTTGFYLQTFDNDFDGFDIATGTSPDDPNRFGNYVRFSSVIGDSFTITQTGLTGAQFQTSIAGVQIIAIPEPATLGLAAVAAGLLRRRR